jgi:hypothetical protein
MVAIWTPSVNVGRREVRPGTADDIGTKDQLRERFIAFFGISYLVALSEYSRLAAT